MYAQRERENRIFMPINSMPIIRSYVFTLIILQLVSYKQLFSLRRFISVINLSYNVNTLHGLLIAAFRLNVKGKWSAWALQCEFLI